MTELSGNKDPQQFENWVKKLQKQSWELELLVTGFSIFLLLQVPDAITEITNHMMGADNSVTTGVPVFLLGFVSLSAKVIAFNLVILIVLRAIWIGYVGLSSVFPQGIRPDKIQTSHFHKEKMRQLYGDNNRHIIRLDKLSSTLFSFSFLIACFIFSLGIVIILTVLTFYYGGISRAQGNQTLAVMLLLSLVLLYLSPLLKFFDLLSFNRFHRNALFAKVSYYLHWGYGWLTLFHLYAPVYYILISNYNRVKIKSLIGGYVAIIFIMATNIQTLDEVYYPRQPQFAIEDYDNLRGKSVIRTASLETDVVEKTYAKLFIRYFDWDDPIIQQRCEGLEADTGQYRFGMFNASLVIGSGDKTQQQRNEYANKALACLSGLYRISIDDKPLDSLQFAWQQRKENFGEKGLVTLLPTADLAPGLHLLKIEKARDVNNPQAYLPWVNISFWKR